MIAHSVKLNKLEKFRLIVDRVFVRNKFIDTFQFNNFNIPNPRFRWRLLNRGYINKSIVPTRVV